MSIPKRRSLQMRRDIPYAFRLRDEDVKRIELLSATLKMKKVDVIRKLLKDAVEKIEREGKKQ